MRLRANVSAAFERSEPKSHAHANDALVDAVTADDAATVDEPATADEPATPDETASDDETTPANDTELPSGDDA